MREKKKKKRKALQLQSLVANALFVFALLLLSGYLQGSVVPPRWEEVRDQVHASRRGLRLRPRHGD